MTTGRVDTLSEAAAIDGLAAEWRALEAATPEANGFQSFAWCRAWIAAARDERLTPRIVTLSVDERLVMLWPLQLEQRFGAAILRWLGEPMTQYGDALALPGAERALWLDAVLAEIRRWRDVDLVALTRLRRDGVLADAGLDFDCVGDEFAAPFADLRASKMRENKSARRRERKLAAFGEVSLETAASVSRRRALARTALAQKKQWLRQKALFSSGLSHGATAALLDRLAQGDFLQLHALTAGPHVAAVDIGFVSNGAYRSLLGSYDLRFAEGAPGHVLTTKLIARCAAEGLTAYDFLPPADSYKLDLADAATSIGARLIPRSLKGHVAVFALARLRPFAKRLAGLLARSPTFRACLKLLARPPRRRLAAGLSGLEKGLSSEGRRI